MGQGGAIEGKAARSPSTVRRKVAVVSAVVLVVAGSAVAWTAYATSRATGQMCTLAGAFGPPVAETPEGAFAAWWRTADHERLRHEHRDDDGRLPDRPTAADFVRDGRNYRWYFASDSWLQVDIDHPREAGVDTSDGWVVVGVNTCGRVEAGDFQPVG